MKFDKYKNGTQKVVPFFLLVDDIKNDWRSLSILYSHVLKS
ncbi:hypothetical protein SAMN05421542_4083 [Chryseobacterium jejuense]|uniref:Uncharacterized protein n=1 Tax=Chryseobacterium jejuense TaxID=445960 RepID=A0A2X2WPZ6_CHRJE|nr:hypothetical protein SAMN05421542_4083 [Chryseobacterium jejuense]SQB43156.1 Uncharacterised protein [Chryseobacterium jejuense]